MAGEQSRGKAGGRTPKSADAPTTAMSPLPSVRPRTPAQARDVALAGSALRHLGSGYYDDYSGWLTVGMALSGLGADGLDLWRAWSEQSEDKYDADVLDAKWASFGRDADDAAGPVVTLGTLFHLAAREGWEHPSNAGAGLSRPAGFTVDLPWLAPTGPRRTS